MKVNNTFKWAWLAFIFLLFVGIVTYYYYYFSGHEFTLDVVQKHANYLYNFVQRHYVSSVILFFLIFIIATICFIPVTVLLSVVAGFLFGIPIGTFISVVGATIGSCIIFLILRHLVGKKIQKKYATKLTTFNRVLEKYGAYYLLALQLLPATPTFVINLGAGLSNITLFTFFWATSLGMLPGALIYAFAGTKLRTLHSLKSIQSTQFLLLLVGLTFFVLLLRVLQSFYKPKP